MQISQLIVRARVPLLTLVNDIFEYFSFQCGLYLLFHTDISLQTTILLPLHFFDLSLLLIGYCVDLSLLYLIKLFLVHFLSVFNTRLHQFMSVLGYMLVLLHKIVNFCVKPRQYLFV